MSRTMADAFYDYHRLMVKPLADDISTLSAGGAGSTTTTVSNMYFGECNTAGDVQAKTVSIPGFSLTNGARVCIKFSYQATIAGLTLNINNTGAFPLKYAGYALPASTIQKNSYLDFVYFNNAYNLVGLVAADADYILVDPATYDECGNIWTKYGNPTLTTENAKFGQALHMTPGNAIRTDGAIITVGEADFTVDLWMYMTNSGINYQRIFQFAPVFYAQDHYFYNGIRFGVGESPGTPFSIGLGTAFTVLDSGEYYNSLIHWAVVYQHDLQKMKVYKNGAKIGELNDVNVARVARQFSFEDITVSDAKFSGYVDELRISDGIARWTENFTPPTEPCTVDEYTKVLLHFD